MVRANPVATHDFQFANAMAELLKSDLRAAHVAPYVVPANPART
jgi:hypothetical protein